MTSRFHFTQLKNGIFTGAMVFALTCLFALPSQAYAKDTPVGYPGYGSTAEAAPLYTGEAEKVVPNQYIVVFKDEVGEAAEVTATADQLSAQGVEVQFVYTSAFKGFAAQLSPEMVSTLQNDPRVEFIEADQIVRINDDEVPSAQNLQSVPVWGLDRIDQVTGINGSFYYPTTAGAGVHAYVIDTGIRTTHNEFGGRATLDYDAVGDGKNGIDCGTSSGHGTHVAGTIGGSTYGVAKNVTLHGVRVLNCEGWGYWSWIAAGVDWVAQNHIKPAVANMSLGGYGSSVVIETAVNSAIASGVTFVIAAGNSSDNACLYTPARIPEAITVGAITDLDAKASFSNYGSCVDIFAPGANIKSAMVNSDDATATWSGTSMATPHVTGAIALYLTGNPESTPATVAAFLIAQSTKNVVKNPVGSPNRLLYSNYMVTSAPALLAPTTNTLISNNTPTLTWNSVNNASEYQLQYANDSAFTGATPIIGINETTYTFSEAMKFADGKWYWRTRGVNEDGVAGPWSTAGYFMVDTVAPAAPRLKLPLNGATFIGTPTFSWNAVSGAVRYQFQYNTSDDKGTDDPASVTYRSGELTTRTHKPPAMMPMAPCYWFVRAKDPAGNWSDWSAPFTVTVLPPKPVAPLLTTPATGIETNLDTPELIWKSVPYGFTFHVQISSNSTFKNLIQDTEGINALSLVTNTLPNGKYYWRVRARNENNVYGPWSASRNFTVFSGFNSQFNGDAAGWSRVAGGYWNVDSSQYYSDGANNTWTQARQVGNISDFTYEVRMNPSNDDWSRGIMVRADPSFTSGYVFLHTGYYFSVWKYKNGAVTPLQPWTSSPSLASDWNKLKVVANGSTFDFYINNTLVWIGSDTSFARGSVGLRMFRSNSLERMNVDWDMLDVTNSLTNVQSGTVETGQIVIPFDQNNPYGPKQAPKENGLK